MFQGRLYAGRLYAGRLFGRSAEAFPVQPVQTGGAHRGLNFVPIIDAEAVFEGVEGTLLAGVFLPSAAASAEFFAYPAAFSTAEVFSARANGYAEFRTDAAAFDCAHLVGEGSSCAAFDTGGGAFFVGDISPSAEAAATFDAEDVVSETGEFYPRGVRNPTEAELITIIQSALDTQRVYM